MNQSDSEEMAGRLLAAGCEEAPDLERASLIVINTCAIREGAEQKVIGRQGHLARLKAANPSLRVVLTGCSVREPDRAGLRRRYPAVDLFLRPDEEPELVDRLGLASAQAPIRAGSGRSVSRSRGRDRARRRRPARGTTTVVGRVTVGAADRLPDSRRAAVRDGVVARGSGVSAWLPIVYGCDKTCTYCIVPFSRGPERSRPFDEVVAEARSLAGAGYREVTLLGQNVNSYGHDLPAEPRFAHVDRDADGRPAARARGAAGPRRAHPGDRRAPDATATDRRSRDCASSPRTRGTCPTGSIAAMADCPSVCEHLHLPVQSGDDVVLRRMGRQYTIAHYLERLTAIRAAVPGIVDLDRRHRRLLRRDRGAVRGDARGCSRRSATTRSSRRPTRSDPARRRPASPMTSRPTVKRRRLNDLLALQEGIGLDGTGPGSAGRPRSSSSRWSARGATITTRPSTTSRRQGRAATVGAAGEDVGLTGRNREHKLVHLVGPASLLGTLVDVRVDHAGPYALRGSLA